MLACIWSLAAAEPGVAREVAPRVAIDIPAATLPAALAALARQSGVSIGWSASLSSLRTPAVRGRIVPAAALERLLRGTPYRAVALAPGVWRIEAVPASLRGVPVRRSRPAPPHSPGDEPDVDAAMDIVVTATKRDQRVATIATALTVADPETLAAIANSPDTGTLARQVVGLFVTNLGPGRNRLFIRGVADSPFDGFAQSSVSVQLDDARLTYDAPDPNLRLVDMAQVEVLKGPQGPLYGTGALGGVYRLVPEKPDLATPSSWMRLGGSVSGHGGPAGTIEAMIDVPLVADTLGLRVVGYRSGQAGWIDSDGGARAINHGVTEGGRITMRARTGAGWTIDLQGIAQAAAVADSQYTERAHTLTRAARLPEPQDTDVAVVSVGATGPIGALTATLSASGTWQELGATYDASSQASALGGAAPATYRDQRDYQVMNYEARVAGSDGAIDWLAGASFLSASTDATGTLAMPTGQRGILRFHREIHEAAVFSEATWRIAPAWAMTGGLRVFRSIVDDRRTERDDQARANQTVVRASPSLSLAWTPRARLMLYARYASALRPGGVESGIGPGPTSITYRADELSMLDVGVRWSDPARQIAVDAGLFGSGWSRVQADLIGPTGLISTRNAGNARNLGAEMSVRWLPARHWTLSAGVFAQNARLESDAYAATGGDRRLPVVPDISGHIEGSYGFEAMSWRQRVALRFSYVGETRLSFDPGLDRESEAVPLATLSWSASRGAWSWRATIDNLADSRADSFAFGNPFTIAATDQHTPVRPRTLSFSVQRRW